MSNIYQISYGKHEGNWNWHSFNVDPSAPVALIPFMETEGNGCATDNYNYKYWENEDGTFDDVILFMSYRGCFGQLRVRYGDEYRDPDGRSYMFVNAFVGLSNKGVLTDPNILVGISKENYHFTYEETQDFSSKPLYDEKFTFESALSEVGINKEQLEEIMACVYLAFNESRNYSTYFVLQSFSEIKYKALSFLILSLLPEQLRYNIIFSNADTRPSDTCQSFKIVKKAPTGVKYYCVNTGETNIKIENVDKYISYFPFYEKYKKYGYNSFCEYSKEIIECTGMLELPYSLSYGQLLMVSKFDLGCEYFQGLDKLDLIEYIRRLLSFNWNTTDAFRSYLIELLEYTKEKDCVIDSDIERKIYPWIERINQQNFNDLYDQLLAIKLQQLEKEKIFTELDSKGNWYYWADLLYQRGAEKSIVEYIKNKIEKYDTIESVKDLIKTIQKNKYSYVKEDTIAESLFTKLFHLYVNKLKENINIEGSFEKILSEYREFINCADKIFNNVSDTNIISLFMKDYELDTFEFNSIYVGNIKTLVNHFENTDKVLQYYIDAFEKTEYFINKEQENSDITKHEDVADNISYTECKDKQAFDYIEAIYSMERYEIKENYIDKVYSFIVSRLKNQKGNDLKFWYQLTRKFYSSENIVKHLIETKLEVFNNYKTFEKCILGFSEIDIDLLENIKNDYEKASRSEDTKSKITKKCLNSINHRLKEVALKDIQKNNFKKRVKDKLFRQKDKGTKNE